MKALVIALLALIAAVVAGSLVADDPGFVVIGYHGKVVRTSFAFFVLLLAVGVFALMLVLRLLGGLGGISERWRAWSAEKRRQRAHDALANGLMAMAEGDFARAERTYLSGLADEHHPEVHYLAAAGAAQAQRAPGRRDNYVRLALDNKPDARTVLNIRRAEWLLENGQLTEARPLIERLAATEIANPHVLRLRLDLYRRTHDSEALLGLMPDLRRDRVLTPDDADTLERSCAVTLLATEDRGLEALEARYGALPKRLRRAPEVLGAYARGLCRYERHDEAEQLVRKRLEREWNSGLAALYGEIECAPANRQLRKIEHWSVQHGNDPGLRLAHARQAIRAEHWERARGEIEALMGLAPSPLLHQLLAEIADGTGDQAAALAHRKTGLELATGERDRAALPPPAARDDAA